MSSEIHRHYDVSFFILCPYETLLAMSLVKCYFDGHEPKEHP